ncbi:hypothetical protein ABW20_dc0106237 [Dactylellina cionopaga]|nr:hypothetical protein ABW20_dc0106237 [Dactylellina cionopaga]
MTTLSGLPLNVLLKTFDLLEVADCARIKQVCRYFHTVVKNCRYTYNFRVDAPSHPTWKLVRFLLANPESNLGAQFHDISVIWERRQAENSETWTKPWKWTYEETCNIRETGKKWKLSGQMIRAILMGMNSEALLPFFLCLTPNLESFDLGDVETKLITEDSRPSGDKVRAVFGGSGPIGYFLDLLGGGDMEDPSEDRTSRVYKDKDTLPEDMEDEDVEDPSENRTSLAHERNEDNLPENTEDKNLDGFYRLLWSKLEKRLIPEPGALWFHQYIKCASPSYEWPPGLAKIKSFAHGFFNSKLRFAS